jgi:hypothetical protein
MTDLRTAAQQALEALEYHTEQTRPIQRTADAIATLRAALAEDTRDWSLLEATQESLREHMAEIQQLRAALAQPATIAEWWAAKQAASGEPFGYLWPTGMHPEFRFYQQKRDGVDGMPLYATAQPAPARVPLTDEQIDRITTEQWGAGLGAPYAAYRAYARAIEAAHGIAAPGAPDALEGTP